MVVNTITQRFLISLKGNLLFPIQLIKRNRSAKFKNDPTNPQNWQYNAEDDYYIDHLGVRFSFYRYSE